MLLKWVWSAPAAPICSPPTDTFFKIHFLCMSGVLIEPLCGMFRPMSPWSNVTLSSFPSPNLLRGNCNSHFGGYLLTSLCSCTTHISNHIHMFIALYTEHYILCCSCFMLCLRDLFRRVRMHLPYCLQNGCIGWAHSNLFIHIFIPWLVFRCVYNFCKQCYSFYFF